MDKFQSLLFCFLAYSWFICDIYNAAFYYPGIFAATLANKKNK